MRIFRLVVVIAVLLSLLVAASAPAYASKDKPPGKKEKPVQVKPKKPKPPKPKDQDQSQPDPAEDSDEDAQEMVTICHKPRTPAQQTLEVAASALQAHLDHGDYEGACVESGVPPVDEPEVDDEGKVTICHKPGTPAEQTLEVAASAVEAHLAHGDELGSCDDLLDETVTEPGTEQQDTTTDVVICHKVGTPEQRTLTVPASAVNAHLAHGDALGPCGETEGMVEVCHQAGSPAQKTLMVPASALDGHLAHGDTLGPCSTETSDVAADAPWVARLVATALSIAMKLQAFAASFTF